MKDYFVCEWKKDLCDSNKYPILRLYKTFHNEYSMSNHLFQVKNPAFRHAITKIRCSSHLLNIERGRHSKPKIPIEQRKSYFCNSLED